MHKLLQLIFFCLCSNIGIAQLNVQFNPIPGSFNVASANPVYAMDINYDSTDMTKQVFHLFLPDTAGSFPLVIFIHGGGYISGTPDVLSNVARKLDTKYFLENGIAFASVGYRLINNSGPDTEGVIKCLNDAKRAMQFVRYYANYLHIDPTKIALKGRSAGASSSYWLGTRSDMADPNATDSILQQSTRVCAVNLYGPQASLDMYKWETDVYNNFDGNGSNYTLDSMENLMGFDRGSNFYGGYDSIGQLFVDPALILYRQEVDQLSHISSDDPPLFISSQSTAVHPSQDLFHHSFHGREIQNAALAVGVSEIKADIPALSINTTNGESGNEFLLRQLNNCSLVSSTNDVTKKEVAPIKIYPNPVQQQLYIDTEIINPSFEVYSTMGQLVLKGMGQEIQIENLSKGIYVLKIASQCLKFVKE